MNREILFKAKRLDNGEWVEGFPYWGEYSGTFILQNKAYRRRNARTGEISMGDDIVPIEVDPSTVCEYTGLTDSNGKRVFCGDILKFRDEPNDYEWVGRVEFGNPNGSYTWGWQLVHMSGPKPNIDILCWFDMEDGGAYSEVIGSIHDGEGGQ